MSLRSPLGRVRGLGAAKEGVGHWWAQRLTALALIPLTLWFAASSPASRRFRVQNQGRRERVLRQAQKQQQSKFLVHKFIFTAQFRPIPSTELSTLVAVSIFP